MDPSVAQPLPYMRGMSETLKKDQPLVFRASSGHPRTEEFAWYVTAQLGGVGRRFQ